MSFPAPPDPAEERPPVGGATSDSNAGPTGLPKGPTPWDETVKMTPRASGPRAGSEPAIPEEAAAMPPNARFGKFIRVRKLGAGGMGEVWKAWDTVLGRWVALKFLKGGDETEIARFLREAQTAGRLHHPHIAAIFEVDQDQGRHYIAMQYVEGHTLHAFPRNDRDLLVRLMADAARAVEYAHGQGVIHRDLKPENLMVSSRVRPDGKAAEFHVYVMDFGLARVTEGASNFSVSGLVVGTPAYMPPEQAAGERVDARADVYALGATLYEVLTDLKPFDGPNVYETLKRVQEEDPVPPRRVDPSIPADLETIVLKCLAKEPAGRYLSAQALSDDLAAFLAGESIQARPESLSRRIARKIRRHPIAVGAMAIVLAALGVAVPLASGGARDRRIAELSQSIQLALGKGEWSEGSLSRIESEVEALRRLAPEQAVAAERGARKALAEAARGAVRSGDLVRARELVALLGPRDAEAARALREDLGAREAVWPGVFRLEEPFGDLGTVLEKGRALREGGVLRRAETSDAPVVTRAPCQGNVELRAEFDADWRKASQVGLLLNATKQAAYHFLLLSSEAGPGTAFESHAGLRMVIRRGESLLREESVGAAVLLGRGELRLLARREGDKLTFQVNDQKPLEVRDPFALSMGQRGVFGLHWPPAAGLRRLQASHRALPVAPGPLDVGDDLFVQGKPDEALERYREAARAAGTPLLRQEARYKEALCHLQSRREEDARPILEEVSGGFADASSEAETRWRILADCQLLLIHFRRPEGLDRASVTLDKLQNYGYGLERLALILPPEIRRQVIQGTFTGSVGANIHRRPEDHLARVEFAVRTAEILEASRADWRHHSLMRAYMMAGRDQDALRTAEKMFRTIKYGGEALDDLSWILRLRGEHGKALDSIDRALPSDPSHRVERARIHVAMKEWEKAREDLEAYFKKPTTYFTHSAACLLEGFLLEQKGAAEEQVQAAWKRGLSKYWKGEALELYKEGRPPSGTPLLHDWILASLTGDMTDAEGEQLLGGLIAFAGKDNPAFNRLMRPSVLRAAWRTPRGRDVARHLAFRDLPFPEFARQPLYLGWVAFVAEVCLAPRPLSADEDALLWQLAQDIEAAYLEGALNEKYFLPFGLILQGTPNYPGMGWKEVSSLLEKAPRLRGPVAYVCARRYAKKGDAANAKRFLQAALADAARDPVYPLLERLARTELGP